MIPYSRYLTVALSVTLVVLVLAGSAAAYSLGQHRSAPGTTGTAIAGDEIASPNTDSLETNTGAGGPETELGSATSATSTAEDAAGPAFVTLSPSAQKSPYATDIADLISRYFTAINRHDYDAWLTTVTTAQAKRDRDNWTHDYSTTHDSDIYISDITVGEVLTVRMQFTSHQDVEFAPAEVPEPCVRWDVIYEVRDEGVGLRVGTSAEPSVMAQC